MSTTALKRQRLENNQTHIYVNLSYDSMREGTQELLDIISLNQLNKITIHLNRYPDIDRRNPWPINYALINGKLAIIQLLIKHKFHVSFQCISYGILHGNLLVTKTMIRYILNTTKWKMDAYQDAINCLVSRNNIYELLMFEKDFFYHKNSYILQCAIKQNNVNIVEWFINIYGHYHNTFIIYEYMYDALFTNNLKMIELLYEYLKPNIPSLDDQMTFCIRRNLYIGFDWIMQLGYQLTSKHIEIANTSYYPNIYIMIDKIQTIIDNNIFYQIIQDLLDIDTIN